MVKMTYISHSCFAVELENSVLVFDYYKGELPAWDSQKTVYVFASHRHYDHFCKEIFGWRARYPKIVYVLSDDISDGNDYGEEAEGCEVTKISPNETKTVGDCTIETFRSTDEGVAFLVSCEGKLFYHAGDLNWWHWDEESESYNETMREKYQSEIGKLKEALAGRMIDVAFLVLDPRQEEAYALGIEYFLSKIRAELAVPMHLWDAYALAEQYVETYGQTHAGTAFWCVKGTGEERIFVKKEQADSK